MKKKKIDWDKVKVGTWFTADIVKSKTIGKIQKEGGVIYFCNNNSEADGDSCDNRLGFEYSWQLDDAVKNIKLLKAKPKGFIFKPIVQVGSYNCTFYKGYVMVGCTKVPNGLVKRIAKKLI